MHAFVHLFRTDGQKYAWVFFLTHGLHARYYANEVCKICASLAGFLARFIAVVIVA